MNKEELKDALWDGFKIREIGGVSEIEMIYVPEKWLFKHIDQLDEPEVMQLDKKIRELESYNDELIRDNNQLRNAMDNQETLSQEWIDEHEIHYNHWVGAVPVTELQNLLVPKQEEEQKYVIKLDDESYLQRYEIDNKNIVTPFRIVGHLKEVAIKFDNKEKAEKVAGLVEGKVEELEE